VPAVLLAAGLGATAWFVTLRPVEAQTPPPTMLVPDLEVRTVVQGLTTPIHLAFLGPDDMLVLEKNTGRVLRVIGGVVQSTVLDLAVNNASERGLLSIALHPDFPATPFVYLHWTCRAPAPSSPFVPSRRECSVPDMLGADTGNILEVPLLGNRLDRFTWDGATLTFDRNLIQLRSFQNDAAPQPPGQGDQAQPPAGNHNAGVLRFGPDGKLYVQVGDGGRRGELQNLRCGPVAECPSGIVSPDDQFGGPEPDDAHFTGVILRLNDDGTAPPDNPFFRAGLLLGGQVGANIQKIFAYGLRNGFGLAFDPVSGMLWEQENGDDTFSELNRVDPGMNSGWVQIAGPISRLAQFKAIETSPRFFGLQQQRWPPTNIANSPAEALARLFMLPGARYHIPEMAWKYEIGPGGMGFVEGAGLGAQYEGNLFMGASRASLVGGHLFRFKLSENRQSIAVDDPRLADGVADNIDKFDVTESESLLIGRDFGVSTDIRTAPNGHLFVVSLSRGAVYEIEPATPTNANK
jgi:glucose/arabinose dehydrogenase